ncbi:hypothetical protein AGLY_016158 [Aphis glycines]|uniref:Uncharacterized protein n=1 Tax=Aphis glycines TaxID=307491 RepID=A0A6G0SYZ7_APHGL|nr:hypothetical protein AGLY_016158 [Aphis glycines]
MVWKIHLKQINGLVLTKERERESLRNLFSFIRLDNRQDISEISSVSYAKTYHRHNQILNYYSSGCPLVTMKFIVPYCESVSPFTTFSSSLTIVILYTDLATTHTPKLHIVVSSYLKMQNVTGLNVKIYAHMSLSRHANTPFVLDYLNKKIKTNWYSPFQSNNMNNWSLSNGSQLN